MATVRIGVEIPDTDYPAYVQEATRQGVTVEALVERIVREMIDEFHTEVQEGTDHPIFPS